MAKFLDLDGLSHLWVKIKEYLNNHVASVDAMRYKGTVSNLADMPGTYKIGDTYKVAATWDTTLNNKLLEVGDMVIARVTREIAADIYVQEDWDIIQGNIEGAVTTEGLIKDKVVLGTGTHTVRAAGTIGAANQPIYLKNGVPTAGTYTIAKSVPSDAKFSDTTYSFSDDFDTNGSAVVAVTLGTTGVTAGTYGPTANVTGDNGNSISVPYFKVDVHGRVELAGSYKFTAKNTTYGVATTSGTGLMSTVMVVKLDGIAANATSDSALTNSEIDSVIDED